MNLKRALSFCLILFLAGTISAQSSKAPLPLPKDFDRDAWLMGKVVDGKVYHPPRTSARLCEDLLANGTAEDIAHAEKILPNLLKSQIWDPDSRFYGAYKWELEMEAVEDLNAVQFILFSLIPLLIEHQDKLSEKTVSLVKESIRIGLINISNIDVHFEYTNIVLKDITNTILGGELLHDPSVAQRGYDKLASWIAFTDRSGGTYEYNSIPYTAVALDVLNKLQTMTQNEDARMMARMMLARVGLSAGLHIHGPTGRWAGPHSRAYHGAVTGSSSSYRLKQLEKRSFEEWLATGQIPNWLGTLSTQEVLPDEILETTGTNRGVAQSTYKTESYAFGIASRDAANQLNRYIAWQSNVFTLHYNRPGKQIPGALYTRYILDDHWLGDFSPGEGRGAYGLIPDDGHFQGVQDKERAIGLYCQTGLGGIEFHSSAKSVIALPRWDEEQDRAWIGDRPVSGFPTPVPQDKTVVFESGDIMIAIKPLTLTNLGHGDQIQLQLMDDQTLVLEMYNYQGPRKIFWELAWPGTFYQGQPQNGFYSEVANRTDYESGAAFAKVIDSGKIIDRADPPSTYSGSEDRKWTVEYQRDGRVLGLEVDLFDWSKTPRRWNHNGDLGWPMLQSSRTFQSTSGRIDLDGVTLKFNAGQAAWLYVSPDKQTVAAAYHGPEQSHLNLQLPQGSVSIDKLNRGLMVWDAEGVSLDTIGMSSQPSIIGNQLRNSH